MAREVGVERASDGVYQKVWDAVEERAARRSGMGWKPDWKAPFDAQLEALRSGQPIAVFSYQLPPGVAYETGLRVGGGQQVVIHPDDSITVVDAEPLGGTGCWLYWEDL